MTSDDTSPTSRPAEAAEAAEGAGTRRRLPPAAQRALAEAEARRAEIEARVDELPREVGGRGGTEPVRYGDWEIKGLASDF
ncbi:MAG: DUF1674 domain-containing protein [Rhizobiaceae bacterium]|nr:DUF1674 domain-containing protein [Rhizobiaceae bacterium]